MKAKPAVKPEVSLLPSDLLDEGYLTIRDLCALFRMSPSWVYGQIRLGLFPRPDICEPRRSRWKVAPVRRHLTKSPTAADVQAAETVMAHAKKASAAGQASRTAFSSATNFKKAAT
jgi:predicted DNA-binding transcriptional regulator AlpA